MCLDNQTHCLVCFGEHIDSCLELSFRVTTHNSVFSILTFSHECWGMVMAFDRGQPRLNRLPSIRWHHCTRPGNFLVLTLRRAVRNTEKNDGARTRPWFAPVLTLKGFLTCQLFTTVAHELSWSRRMVGMSFRGYPYFSSLVLPD